MRGCAVTRSCTRRRRRRGPPPAPRRPARAPRRRSGAAGCPAARSSALSRPWALVSSALLEGVAADQLGEPVGLVRRRAPDRAHLDERDLDAALGERPGGFAAREARRRRRSRSGWRPARPLPPRLRRASSAANSVPHFRHFRNAPRRPCLLALRARRCRTTGTSPAPGGSRREVARRIARAAVERLAPLAPPLGQVAVAALRALHAERASARCTCTWDSGCRRGTRRSAPS